MEARTYFAFCAGRDQRVRVVRRSELLGEPAPGGTYPDPSDVICLEWGRACTGTTCPLFGVPSREMAARMAEAGLLHPYQA